MIHPIIKYLALFTVIIVVFSSCKKRWIDKRNKYYGDWQMRVISDDWSLGRNPMHIIDTVDYTAKVTYDVGVHSNGTLNITTSNGTAIKYILKEDGNLEMCSLVGSISESTLAINLNSTNSCAFGMGSGTYYSYTGRHLK